MSDDTADFETSVRRHYPTVLAYLRARTHDHDLALDLAQETFLQAARSRDAYDPARGDLASWLVGIARHVRASAARRPAVETPAADAVAEAAWDAPRDDARLTALRACLDTLAERARTVVSLVYDQGLTYAAIAARLDMGLSAVKVAAFRTRTTLMECVRRRLEGKP